MPESDETLMDELARLRARVSALEHTESERRRVEAVLVRTRHQFELILNSVTEGIYGMDRNGNTMFVNAAATGMVGWAHDELVGRPHHEIVHHTRPDGRTYPRAECPVHATLRDGRPRTVSDEVYWRRDGGCFLVEYTCSAIVENGAPTGAVVTFSDITERKRAEIEAETRRQQMFQASKMESMEYLVAGVAHEINNPNGLIKLAVPLLQSAWFAMEPLLDRHREEHGEFMLGGLPYMQMRENIPVLLRNILDGSERIRRIVDDLRVFTRKSPPEHMEPLDVNALVTSATTLLAGAIRKSTGTFHAEYGRGLPPVIGNYQRLEQALINIIHNACQAVAGSRKPLRVRTFYDAPSARLGIAVEDEGPGIPPDEFAHLAEPFFTTKRAEGGKGLGLAVASAVINTHGGALEIDSAPGAGTRVTIRLPAAPDCNGKETP